MGVCITNYKSIQTTGAYIMSQTVDHKGYKCIMIDRTYTRELSNKRWIICIIQGVQTKPLQQLRFNTPSATKTERVECFRCFHLKMQHL